MTDSQLVWARTHDWFVRVINTNAIIVVVRETMITESGEVRETLRRFSDFGALYRWAGY